MALERERRLGRGIQSLLGAAMEDRLDPETIAASGRRTEMIRVDLIDPNPYQPRREFDAERLEELKSSLATHGLIQPIVVRRFEARFQLVAGERRFRAARDLGWATILAIVVEIDERSLREWALIENLQRENLGPLEVAESLRSLADAYAMSPTELSRALGMSRPAVSNFLRILELPATVKDHVSRGTVSMGAARALLSIDDPAAQESLAQRIADEQLSVRAVEEEVRRWGERRPEPKSRSEARPTGSADARELSRHLADRLGLDVRIQGSGDSGRVVIRYETREDLHRLIRQLEGADELGPRGEDDEDELVV